MIRHVHVVTGARGYLGAALVKLITRAEPESSVIALDRTSCDLLSQTQTHSVFRNIQRIDYIYHLAEVNGNFDWSIENSHDQLIQNLTINTNVISAWTKFHPAARMIAANSAWSYPENISVATEANYFCSVVNGAIQHFAFTKQLMVLALSTAATQYNLQGTSLVLGTVYGPEDESDHLIPTILKKIELNSKIIELSTPGFEKRDFVFVNDQVLGIYLHRNVSVPVLNISSGVSTSVRDVITLIVNMTKYQGKVVYSPLGAKHVRDRIIDVGMAHALTGWPFNQRLRTLEEGLRITIESR